MLGHTSLDCEEEILLLDALYTPGVQVWLLSLVSLIKSGFLFNSSTDGLDILHHCNVFVHVTLKNNLLLLDLDYCCNNSSSIFVSHFDYDFESIKCYARLAILAKIE